MGTEPQQEPERPGWCLVVLAAAVLILWMGYGVAVAYERGLL
jgi:hypothetical protein